MFFKLGTLIIFLNFNTYQESTIYFCFNECPVLSSFLIHHISKIPFMFFDRYWFHIHDLGDFIRRIFGIFRYPSFPKLRKFWKSRYAEIVFLKMFGDFSCIVWSVFVINKGCKRPDLVIFFGSAKNDPKSTGICPGTLIGHFGIIEKPRKNKTIDSL